MVKVISRRGEPPRNLFLRFRKAVTHNGVMSQVRKGRWFISKIEQRRRAKKKAIRRLVPYLDKHKIKGN